MCQNTCTKKFEKLNAIKTASVFEHLFVHCFLFIFDEKIDWISSGFFLKIRFIDRKYGYTVNIPTNGDESHCSDLSLSTGLRFRVAPLFRDTLEIKFTRNSAYFVLDARA